MTATRVKSYIAPRNVRQIEGFNEFEAYKELENIGIAFDDASLGKMVGAMDSLTPTLNAPTIGTPIQYLQHWMPGLVRNVTAKRNADNLAGLLIAGEWSDEEIVQIFVELLGDANLYGDRVDDGEVSWNPSFERRTVVRFANAAVVGQLEEARASAMNVSTANEKRSAASTALEIMRNRIGMFGFNGGANRTYGFLSDPSLPGYVTVPNGASGNGRWATQTFAEIVRQVQIFMAALEVQSKGVIDSRNTPITMAIPTGHYNYLTTPTGVGGVSVLQWLRENYPNLRVESAPELTAANGSADVGYVYAESVDDGSSDGGATFAQIVPAKFRLMGVERKAKSYSEHYMNATAGTMCKRPWAVYRFSGI